MQFRSICLLLLGLGLGCNGAEQARQRAVEEDLRQIESALQSYYQNAETLTAEPSHVIVGNVPYYTSGPQQGRPPDGTFPAGTKVRVVDDNGSHLLVRTEGGVEAYVAAEAVRSRITTTMTAAMNAAAVVEGSNRFALDLYQQVRSDTGNLFFSPNSISAVLAMAQAGAVGETAEQMARVLHLQMPSDRLHAGMRIVRLFGESVGENKGARLHVANRLWAQEGYPFRPAFLQITREQYGAELESLDFGQSEDARQQINQWVEEQTEQKIKGLIPARVLTADTRLVLTNAIYFHGVWSDPFLEDRTKDEAFHLTADDEIVVPLMHRRGAYRYAAMDELRILELPYGDGSLSMVVLLPDEVAGLGDLEAKLTFDNLQRWIGSLQHEDDVRVYLPKFKTASQFELSDTLRSMGMELPFDASAADFSGMADGSELVLSAVIHKAFVDVNEEGTEAAAATGAVVAVTAAPAEPKEPPVFRADHPFVLMIRDNRSGAILFLGRIVNPLQ